MMTADSALRQPLSPTRTCSRSRLACSPDVPMIHKDIFCTEGVLTTCGSKMLSNFVAPYDAHLVDPAKAAGMVMVGSPTWTSSPWVRPRDQLLWPREEPVGPDPECPVDRREVQRLPWQHAWHLWRPATYRRFHPPASRAVRSTPAFKPTYGRVSRYGMIAFSPSSLDQGGEVTVSAKDSAIICRQLQASIQDTTSVDVQVPDYSATLDAPLAGMKIGIFDVDNTAPQIEVQSAVRNGPRATIKFTVTDNQSAVQRVELSLDASRWRVAYPSMALPTHAASSSRSHWMKGTCRAA